MKIFNTLTIIAFIITSMNVSAQNNEVTNNNNELNKYLEVQSSKNGNNRLDVNSAFSHFKYSTKQLTIDLTPSDPRLFSNTGEVVFYNTYGGGFNDIQVRTCYQYSDGRAKRNILPVKSGLEKIQKLNGVNYNWKTNTGSKLCNKLNSGFIAQEVEKIIPEAVINNSDGKKLISYAAILPYLVEAIKEQQQQIEELKKLIKTDSPESKNNTINPKSALKETFSSKAILYQNSPNPFNADTKIKYFIPENSKTANLYIYNMQGSQIKSFPLHNRGESNEFIYGAELKPGMYIYTLIIDSQEVDSKRMILTD